MNHFMEQPLSPDGQDICKGDIPMLESPDSGYRSPQDYVQTAAAAASHVVLFTTDEPYLKIVEEPVEKFRFRYKSEMAGTHGSLNGMNSDRSRKQTFPTVVLRNFNGKAVIRCSLYQHNTEEDNRPHAHRLVRKCGNDEIDDPHDIEVTEDDGYLACFQNMGIIHTAKKFLVSVLHKKKYQLKKEELKRIEGQERKLTSKEEREIEWAATAESKTIDLNIVRLRFDAFVRSQYDQLVPICPPVYSHCINNLKSALTGELKIVRMSQCSSSCKGGSEIFLLVEKVTKKNIAVRFFEEDEDGNETWEAYGKFSEVDVHHQYAIVLKTPAFKDVYIEHEVKVFIELVRKTDNSRSDPKEFKYTPSNVRIGAKRQRTDCSFSSSYCNSSTSRSLDSTEIPATIFNVLPTNSQSSISEINLSEDLKVSSEELERMYRVIRPGLASVNSSSLAFDGPLNNRNSRNFGATKENMKSNLRDVELQYCWHVYREVFAQRKSNPSESQASKFLNTHFSDRAKQMPTGNSPLHIIACNYSNETKQYLDFFLTEIRDLNQRHLLNLRNNDKQTPLHLAVSLNVRDVAEKLVLADADVNCKDTKGNTILHLAVKNNNEEIVDMVFRYAKNVNVNEENNDGDTPLNIAIRMGYYLCFATLCRNKADVNKDHKKDGYTPLRMAVERSDVKMVKFLLNNTNADATIGDFRNILPITAALVLQEPTKPETQEVYALLEQHMQQSGVVTTDITIKEEMESDNEADDASMELEVKKEDSEKLKKMYENVKEFTPAALEEFCRELDASGGWLDLVDLLDLKHFLETTIVFENQPTKTLIQLALNKGESLYQIREFLGLLEESRAVEIMDSMLFNQI